MVAVVECLSSPEWLSRNLISKLVKVSLPRPSVAECKPIRVATMARSQVGIVKRKKTPLASAGITETIDEMMTTEETVGIEIKLSALHQVCLLSHHSQWLDSRFHSQLRPTACQCSLLVSYSQVKQPRSHNNHHLRATALENINQLSSSNVNLVLLMTDHSSSFGHFRIATALLDSGHGN